MLPTVSTAAIGDVDEIAELAARTFPLACPPGLAAPVVAAFVDEHLTAEAFRGYLGTPGHQVLCARSDEGGVIGYALLVDGTGMDPSCRDQIHHRPTVGVSKFYIDPGHHGTGAAGALLTTIMDRASTRGARSLWLATNVQNLRARRFYAKHGFVERGERTFVVGGEPHSDVVYEKPLRPDPASPTRARNARARAAWR